MCVCVCVCVLRVFVLLVVRFHVVVANSVSGLCSNVRVCGVLLLYRCVWQLVCAALLSVLL